MNQQEFAVLLILIVMVVQIVILIVIFILKQKTQSDELERQFNWIHYPSKKKKENE